MDKKLMVMVGIPGAGKSFVANSLCDLCTEIGVFSFDKISSDEVRYELTKSYTPDYESETLVWKKIYDLVANSLKKNEVTIFDATNLTHKTRARLVNEIKSRGVKKFDITYHVVATPLEICINRQRDRIPARAVPENVIKQMVKAFEVPLEKDGDVRFWSGVELKDKTVNFDAFIARTTGFNQQNKHHKLTLDKHMEETVSYLYRDNGTPSFYLALAARYHDVGKIYTKELRNGGTEATYYNHQNVGAYVIIATFAERIPRLDLYKIAILIEHHMDFYTRKDSLHKVKEMIGEKLFEDLLILHEADLAAH